MKPTIIINEKEIGDLIEKNTNKVGRGIRITKEVNDKISWLIYHFAKQGEKINISRIVERSVDVFHEMIANPQR